MDTISTRNITALKTFRARAREQGVRYITYSIIAEDSKTEFLSFTRKPLREAMLLAMWIDSATETIHVHAGSMLSMDILPRPKRSNTQHYHDLRNLTNILIF